MNGSAAAGDELDELLAAVRGPALRGHPGLVREYRLSLAQRAATKTSGNGDRAIEDDPAWHRIRDTIVGALEPFPDARHAVADALASLD